MDQRDRLAPAAAVNAEVGQIRGNHGVFRVQFAQAGSKKQAALQAAGLAESESAGKIACPTSRAFSWGFAGRRPIPTDQAKIRQIRFAIGVACRQFRQPRDVLGQNQCGTRQAVAQERQHQRSWW
jgi:hypothetical protein